MRPLASAPLAAPLPRRSEAEPFRNSRSHGRATVVLWSVSAFLLQTPGGAPAARGPVALQTATGDDVAVVHEFVLEGAEEALRDRVVVGVALGTHAGVHPPGGEPLPVGMRTVQRPLIGVVDEPLVGQPCEQGHVERMHRQRKGWSLTHRPAHHPTRVEIEQHGQVQEARAGADDGQVTHPHSVGYWHVKLALHQVGRGRRGGVMLHDDSEAALAPRLDPGPPSQSRYPMLAAGDAPGPEFQPRLHRSVGLAARRVNLLDVPEQRTIAPAASRVTTRPPLVVAAPRYREYPTQPAHTASVSMHERIPHPRRLAKYAVAFFRMSRSSLSRAFSRRSRESSLSSASFGRPGAAWSTPPAFTCACHL